MIKGKLEFEDIKLNFQLKENGMVIYDIKDTFLNLSEVKKVGADGFFKALAIMVHSEGMPDFKTDYKDAEFVMPNKKELRWIP